MFLGYCIDAFLSFFLINLTDGYFVKSTLSALAFNQQTNPSFQNFLLVMCYLFLAIIFAFLSFFVNYQIFQLIRSKIAQKAQTANSINDYCSKNISNLTFMLVIGLQINQYYGVILACLYFLFGISFKVLNRYILFAISVNYLLELIKITKW